MRIINQEYDIILETMFRAQTSSDIQNGDIVPHKQVVSMCYMYVPHNVGGEQMFLRVYLSPKMIKNLYDQINELESVVKESAYYE